MIHFEGRAIPCEEGDRLRLVLLRAGVSPHNGQAQWLNCRGNGTCGTCAVQVEGPVSGMGPREKARLSFPPHTLAAGLRLACQARVLGDVTVTKHEGFWGQNVGQRRATGDGGPRE